MILNHLFREISNVLTIEGITYIIYIKVYKVCHQVYEHNDDYYRNIVESVDDNEFKDKEYFKEIIGNS